VPGSDRGRLGRLLPGRHAGGLRRRLGGLGGGLGGPGGHESRFGGVRPRALGPAARPDAELRQALALDAVVGLHSAAQLAGQLFAAGEVVLDVPRRLGRDLSRGRRRAPSGEPRQPVEADSGRPTPRCGLAPTRPCGAGYPGTSSLAAPGALAWACRWSRNHHNLVRRAQHGHRARSTHPYATQVGD
jgi:hypothetical protein